METLIEKPASARALYVLAHGAGAGMRHPFMQTVAERLAERSVATLRYEFPYMSAGRRRPDPPHLLEAQVRAAVEEASKAGLPMIAGGKSLGGRMTSRAAADGGLGDVKGLVYLGFPLHAPGRVSDKRAAHLDSVEVPQLFIQGTRDALADLELMRAVCKRLGDRATLHVVEGGDHSFKVLKKSGRDPEAVMDEIADAIDRWIGEKIL
jgi:predicted alpha/beta-hydrolase family hydrolase